MDRIAIEALAAESLTEHPEDLAELFNACVHAGASISFVLPHSLEDSCVFWSEGVFPAVKTGKRLLLVAKADGRAVGSVQLDWDTLQNQPHRAEVRKLLVHPDFRRRGIARRLMVALEVQARGLGRSLITLDTRTGDAAEPLCTALGCLAVGIIPGFALDPYGSNRPDATTIMYRRL